MKEFNAEKYRDNLAEKLKSQKEGSILDKTKELFLSNESKEELMKKRHEKAQEFLSKERFSDEYKDAKDITHPEILEKSREIVRKARKEWDDKASELMRNERINNIEDFKKEYPDFESFLKNKDISFLVENGAKKVLIKKDSKEYEDLLAMEPYRNSYGFQCAHIGTDSADAKIITESETHNVLLKCYSENNMDGWLDIEESKGQTVGEAMEKFKSSKNIALATCSDGNFGFTYSGRDMYRLAPFLEKLDPEFFKGGGKYVGGMTDMSGKTTDVGFFENVSGQRKAITPGDFGPFIKEDTTLYLCRE